MRFWLKISICQTVKAVWCTETVVWVAWQGLETWKHRQSAEHNLQDNQAAVDRIRHIAVEDLDNVLSREDKAKRHRSAREISHEIAVLRSRVRRIIIYPDLQLKCFTWRHGQLMFEANRISSLTFW